MSAIVCSEKGSEWEEIRGETVELRGELNDFTCLWWMVCPFYVGISFILYGVFRIILSFKWKKFNDRIRKEEEEEIIEPEVVE